MEYEDGGECWEPPLNDDLRDQSGARHSEVGIRRGRARRASGKPD